MTAIASTSQTPINIQETPSNTKKTNGILASSVRFEFATNLNKRQIHISPGNMEYVLKKKFKDCVDNKTEKYLKLIDKKRRHFGFIVLPEKDYFCHILPIKNDKRFNTAFCILASESFQALPPKDIYKQIKNKRQIIVEIQKDSEERIKKIFVAKKWVEEEASRVLSAIGLCEFYEGSDPHMIEGKLTDYKILDLAEAKLVPLNDEQYAKLIKSVKKLPVMVQGREERKSLRNEGNPNRQEHDKKACMIQ